MSAPADLQFGVDISNHQGDRSSGRVLDLAQVAREGFVAVLAKASEGSGYRDWTYPIFRDAARANGLTFVAYHYLRGQGGWYDAEAEAACFHSTVNDPAVPVMLDCEDGTVNVAHIRDVKAAIERRGYRVVLTYLPRWYWAGHIASPDLTGLPPLMASSYVTGSGFAWDLYPGDAWGNQEGYGGATTALLQFTSSATVAGRMVDAWAFRGSRDQLGALINGTPIQEDFMATMTDAEKAELLQAVREINTPVPDIGAGDPIEVTPLRHAVHAASFSRRVIDQGIPAVVGAVAAVAQAHGSDLTTEQITQAVHDGMASVVKVDVSVQGPK